MELKVAAILGSPKVMNSKIWKFQLFTIGQNLNMFHDPTLDSTYKMREA